MFRFKKSKTHVAVERQRSVEYLAPLEDNSRDVHSSTPDMSSNPDLAVKKVKKKRHFGVFHRHHHHHKDRHKNELDHRLNQSLSIPSNRQQHTNGHGASPSHLSLDSTWSHGSWRPLDPAMRNSSAHSSNVSLLSVESEGREMSDEELVESLVNPQGRGSSLAASVTPPVSKAGCTLLGCLLGIETVICCHLVCKLL